MSEAKKHGASLLSSGEDDNNRLRPVTIRFPTEAWEAIRSISAERGCSMAETVRQVVEYGLSDIDGYYLREEQMSEIRTEVIRLMDTISQVERELHRIGINYNQEIRLRNIQRKYHGLTDIDSRMKAIKETETVKKDSSHLSKEKLECLIQRYEDATRKAGEILCRILE